MHYSSQLFLDTPLAGCNPTKSYVFARKEKRTSLKTLKADEILNCAVSLGSRGQLTLLPPSPSAPRLPQYSLLILVSNNASFKDRNDQTRPSSIFLLLGSRKALHFCGSGNTTHATVLDAGLAKLLRQHKALVTCDGQRFM